MKTVKCKLPRRRHRFENDVCVFCNVSRKKKKARRLKASSSSAKLKLETASELIDSYLVAKTNLVKFVGLHHSKLEEYPDILEEASRQFLDELYKDLGREVFWSKAEISQ